jgi:hypothetical protein
VDGAHFDAAYVDADGGASRLIHQCGRIIKPALLATRGI